MVCIADFISIIISIFALIVSFSTYNSQAIHNRKSVIPLCAVAEKYHEHNVAILIVNRGLGAMIIDDFKAQKDGETRDNLITFMPKVEDVWKGFSLEIAGRVVMPGDNIVLCAIDPQNDDVRQQILEAMSGIEIKLKFRDIYEKEYEYSKKLEYCDVFYSDFGYKAI